uniref:Uncharacterized protein n=1 Tax=Romanomermis culicivorax TaxID=13658 RepID=A0A915J0R9_ROMCU
MNLHIGLFDANFLYGLYQVIAQIDQQLVQMKKIKMSKQSPCLPYIAFSSNKACSELTVVQGVECVEGPRCPFLV